MPMRVGPPTPPTPPQGPDPREGAQKLNRQLRALVYELETSDRTNYRDKENLTALAGTINAVGDLVEKNRGMR